ncbi:Uncharacterised protein [Bordetella pertussis]|nr:Uncharacterised protein [Bordetella pertussis]
MPDWICGRPVVVPPKYICTCPPSSADMAGATPWYGTCTTSMPAARRNISPAMWVEVP